MIYLQAYRAAIAPWALVHLFFSRHDRTPHYPPFQGVLIITLLAHYHMISCTFIRIIHVNFPTPTITFWAPTTIQHRLQLHYGIDTFTERRSSSISTISIHISHSSQLMVCLQSAHLKLSTTKTDPHLVAVTGYIRLLLHLTHIAISFFFFYVLYYGPQKPFIVRQRGHGVVALNAGAKPTTPRSCFSTTSYAGDLRLHGLPMVLLLFSTSYFFSISISRTEVSNLHVS